MNKKKSVYYKKKFRKYTRGQQSNSNDISQATDKYSIRFHRYSSIAGPNIDVWEACAVRGTIMPI